MPSSDPIVRSIPPRLELKYWISEREASALHRDVSSLLAPDPYTPGPGRGYRLASLYFDTPDLTHYQATLRGDHDRLKLRARVYDDTGPVHLEVKRKTHDTVRKSRGRVPRDSWIGVANGSVALDALDTGDVDKVDRADDVHDAAQSSAIAGFTHAFVSGACRPACLVRYEREAYVSTMDRYARVTFDRHVTASAAYRMSFEGEGEPVVLDRATTLGALEGHVLIELKAERFVPSWMSELIRIHGLRRRAFSKYGAGMDALLARQGRRPSWRRLYD